MAKALLLASFGALALAGCGGNVIVDGNPRTTTTGSTTSGTISTTGTGGTTTTGTTTTGTTTTGVTTGTGDCGPIEVAVDNGALQPFASMCANANWNPTHTTTAIGYLIVGGPPPGISVLHIDGCESGAPGARALDLKVGNVMGPGAFTNGSAAYTDGMGTTFYGVMGKTFLDVPVLGPPGQQIIGKFNAVVASGSVSHVLSGSFQVCRVPDEDVP